MKDMLTLSQCKNLLNGFVDEHEEVGWDGNHPWTDEVLKENIKTFLRSKNLTQSQFNTQCRLMYIQFSSAFEDGMDLDRELGL